MKAAAEIPPRGLVGDERGVITVFFALIITSLMVMLALVVDLGNMRSMRRDVQAEVDLAALAAGEHLRTFDAGGACSAAVRYLRINIPGLPDSTSVPCDTMPATCNDTTTAAATVQDEGTAAPWTVRITYPVPDAQIADPTVPGGVRSDDGTPCERIRVDVQRTTDGYFSSIVGLDSYAARASAVARRTNEQRMRVPNLWLLEPYSCEALLMSGNGIANIGSATVGGLVTLDSTGDVNGNKCSASKALEVTNNARLNVFPAVADPPAQITLVALAPGQTLCNSPGNPRACEQADFDGPSPRANPQPTRRTERATRALVDHIFNCKASYPVYESDNASLPAIPIRGCAQAGSRDPFIDQLRKQVTEVGRPDGFQVWPAEWCSVGTNTAVPAELPGNWWIDCAGGLTVNGRTLNFTGGNVVISQGGLTLKSGALLQMNTAPGDAPLSPACQTKIEGCYASSSADATFLWVNGAIEATAASTVDLRHTAVIQNAGHLSLSSGVRPNWTSPKEGPFRGLSLWSETKHTGYGINGGGSLGLEGIFFTPEADAFDINGGGGSTALQAQFISRRLKITGGGTLNLEPSGTDFIRLPPPAALLIR